MKFASSFFDPSRRKQRQHYSDEKENVKSGAHRVIGHDVSKIDHCFPSSIDMHWWYSIDSPFAQSGVGADP